MRQQGFTLLELMIAITLSALLGLATLNLVSQMATSQERINASTATLDRLGAAKSRLEADLTQFAPHRPVADDFGNEQPALVYSSDGVLELTRLGWPRSIVNTPLRSDLQRLEYRLVDISNDICRMGLTTEEWDQRDSIRGFCLVRRYRQHLEAERDNPWVEQVVLAPLSDMSLRFQTQDANGASSWHDVWPPDRDDRALSIRGIELTLDFDPVGPAQFFWEVPAQLHDRSED
ncbi:prepilin-type N-terminal cleavage/methylation domain-containing protein [Salinispirillum sp. LH 10-3-1]|uniref:Type II secretion system protein J n=1 Tax=Salinispirillum sp. LH 10-3-1 TaxID=2952525 RepID=A0AB38YBF1_9GAMM